MIVWTFLRNLRFVASLVSPSCGNGCGLGSNERFVTVAREHKRASCQTRRNNRNARLADSSRIARKLATDRRLLVASPTESPNRLFGL